MKEKGIDAGRWLETITKDQNLETILDLVKTKISGARRWFRSAIIQPIIVMGRYNPVTDLYELGVEDRNPHTMVFSTVSGATTDFVITNGETWEVYIFTGMNQTRASVCQCLYYDGTNTFPLMGVDMGGSAGTIMATGSQLAGPIRITGNGTIALRINLLTYVALDTVRCLVAYRRVN